ncbi:MAG: hypothetical protein AB4062_19770 [Crocosphaera sp.]
MLRSTTFDNFLSECTTVEQILDLCGQALYNRYFATAFLVTGIEEDGSPINSSKIHHWAGSQLIGETNAQEQTITTFTSLIGIQHKQSLKPWLEVFPIGDPGDTPNGVFA